MTLFEKKFKNEYMKNVPSELFLQHYFKKYLNLFMVQ